MNQEQNSYWLAQLNLLGQPKQYSLGLRWIRNVKITLLLKLLEPSMELFLRAVYQHTICTSVYRTLCHKSQVSRICSFQPMNMQNNLWVHLRAMGPSGKQFQTWNNLSSSSLFLLDLLMEYRYLYIRLLTRKSTSSNPSIFHFHQAFSMNPTMPYGSFYEPQTGSWGQTFNKIPIFQFSRPRNMRGVTNAS